MTKDIVFAGNVNSFSRNRPDFTNTEPAANIGPFPQWADKKKIVSMDPLGHLAPWLFKGIVEGENGQLGSFSERSSGQKLTMSS